MFSPVLMRTPRLRLCNYSMSLIHRLIQHLIEDDDEDHDDLKDVIGEPPVPGKQVREFDPKRDLVPTPNEELNGIARFVRDTNNATGEGDLGWEWDPNRLILTIHNEDGGTSRISGEDIANSCPDDDRFNRIRFILYNQRRHPKRKKI